jgi:hypothetical protein
MMHSYFILICMSTGLHAFMSQVYTGVCLYVQQCADIMIVIKIVQTAVIYDDNIIMK